MQGQKLKVLVVDDNESSRVMVNFFVQHLGCDAVLANDGNEGLQHLKSEDFDLMILDWRMPNLGGKETLLNADESLSMRLPDGKKMSVLIYTESNLGLLDLPSCSRLQVRNLISKRGSPHQQSKSFEKAIRAIIEENSPVHH